jgi:hypothetical protein
MGGDTMRFDTMRFRKTMLTARQVRLVFIVGMI